MAELASNLADFLVPPNIAPAEKKKTILDAPKEK